MGTNGQQQITIKAEDPRTPDIAELLETHVAFSLSSTPAENSFALDAEELTDPTITFFACRVEGTLVAIGALKQLDERHGEIKSMHTVASARRSGYGSLMMQHLLKQAVRRGYTRLSLETGRNDDFAPARALYLGLGFVPCPPFGEYQDTPDNLCMTLELPEPPS